MVNIGPNISSMDPLGEKRRLEQTRSSKTSQSVEKGSQAQSSDSLSSGSSIQAADVERYVSILKNMNPADLHRVDDLRNSIEDGSYTSELNELIDPLLNFLSDDSTPA